MRLFFAFFVLLVGLVFPHDTHAHGMRTAYVEIVEHAPGQAILRIRMTITGNVAPNVSPECNVKPAGTDTPAPRISATNALVQNGSTYVVHCPNSIAGRVFGVSGLGQTISEAVVWVAQHDGTTSSHLVSMAQPNVKIPPAANATSTLGEYVPLGVRHIFAGADHLLFLLLLVLLLRHPKPVLIAETAFTVSHGLSFSAAALGWMHVSKEATEACIALSLLFLALDVERRDKRVPAPGSVATLALVFGLVHGLGFAGGMSELGMPDRYVGWALLGFGLGVEVGQVAFLIVALAVVHLLRRSRFSFQGTIVLTYLAGGLAAYWFLDRVRDCVLARFS